MAGTGIGESIFYIGAIVLAVGFVGVFGAVIIEANNDLEQHGQRASESLRAELVILDDPDQLTTAPPTLHAKNVGTQEIATDQINVFINGQVAGNVTFDVLGSADDTLWTPGTVIRITVNDLTLPSGTSSIRLAIEQGPEDSLEVVV